MSFKISICYISGRFRRLKYIEQLESDTMIYTTAAACCLHNICILQEDIADMFDEEDDDDETDVPVAALTMNALDFNSRHLGVIRRNKEMQKL